LKRLGKLQPMFLLWILRSFITLTWWIFLFYCCRDCYVRI
jgi:hypothetical protein